MQYRTVCSVLCCKVLHLCISSTMETVLMTVGIGFVETYGFWKIIMGRVCRFPTVVSSCCVHSSCKISKYGPCKFKLHLFFFFFDNFKRTLKFWCHETANMVSHSFLTKISQTPHLNWRTKGHNTSVLPSSSRKSDAKYKVSCLIPQLLPTSTLAYVWIPTQQCTQLIFSDKPRINQYCYKMLRDISVRYFCCRNLFIWNCGGFCFKINYQKT